ncbi:MAG TPA: FxLYD domain-containing protein [Candidatus Binataceae bacterium]|nr:FxLYD domain-containing protein [Candidatus Binataceae bacterium]
MRKNSAVILLIAIAFAGFVFYSLWRVEPVRVANSRLEHRDGRIFVDGNLRNTGGDLGPVDVEVHYYDAGGRALGQDKVVIAGMKKDALAHFATPPRRLDGVSDFSIYLNHGRNPYGN